MSKLNCFARDVELGQAAGFREFLDRMPVLVAGREIHRGIDAVRVLAQLLLDEA